MTLGRPIYKGWNDTVAEKLWRQKCPSGAHLPHSTTPVLPSSPSPTTSCHSLLSSHQKKTRLTPQHLRLPHHATTQPATPPAPPSPYPMRLWDSTPDLPHCWFSLRREVISVFRGGSLSRSGSVTQSVSQSVCQVLVIIRKRTLGKPFNGSV